MSAIVTIQDVEKEYSLGATVVKALRGVSLTVDKGEFISIAGPSGSGKTTLLNLIGCVDTATRGDVVVSGRNTAQLSERELTDLRLNTIGFIFQSFNLVSVLSVYQNVEFPLLLQDKLTSGERKKRVDALLDQVGLASHTKHRPNELSGGQRQRVAIARALVTDPLIVLADEPTANLDSQTGQAILDLMKSLNQQKGTTFIFSTHDHKVMRYANAVIRLADGKILGREKPEDAVAHAVGLEAPHAPAAAAAP
ncbi:MAG: ABC transporter ATP-binding protein [Myxococcaceae bacterium]